MSVKRKPLSEALAPASEEPPVEVKARPKQAQKSKPAIVETATTDKSKRQPGRKGKTNVSGWHPVAVSLELEDLRLERSRALGRKVKLQELHAEALNELFKKYGRPELAEMADG